MVRDETPKSHKRNLVVEVLRDEGGKLFSQVRDRNKVGKEYYHRLVVIDRQRGRGMDQDTVINRAQAMAELTGFPYVENLEWPCRARQGFTDCGCPECVKRTDKRGRGRK